MVTELEEVKQLHEFIVLKRTIVAGIEVVGVDDKEDEVEMEMMKDKDKLVV